MKTLAAVLCAAALCVPVLAAPAKPAAKTVTVYKADKCGMLFTAAQAKKYNYACPDSKGKMTKVAVPAAVAKAGLAQTAKALPPAK